MSLFKEIYWKIYLAIHFKFGSCQILELINYQNSMTPLTWLLCWKLGMHPLYLSVSRVLWHKCQTVFKSSWSMQGMLEDFVVWWAASFWWQWTMTEGTMAVPCKVPTQTRSRIENRKMYAVKQLTICAKYRYLVSNTSAGLSDTPRLRPMVLNRYSRQNCLGPGYHVLVFCTDLNL